MREVSKGATSDDNEHVLKYDSDEERKKQKMREINQRAKSLATTSVIDQSAREVQIIFCTRTHSQISQIVNEIKRTDFSREVSVVPIVSRRGLCVHESLKDLQNVGQLNEKC